MIYDKRSHILRRLLIIMGSFIIIVSIFMTLWMRTSIKSLEYKLGKLQQKQHELLKERRNLRAQKDDLLSINTVNNVAIKKLGLDYTDRTKVFYIKDGI
ncbi:Cell division protein FtsL [Candidatus Magnetoovum chiemensis]|nr:Cell division protein FtsL [Candidatus Magnetoovum chiemensis]